MKYWLLTTEFPPFFGGGISTYCRETVQMLSTGGYQVSVFLPDRAVDGIVCSEEENTRVIRFNPFGYRERAFLGYETLVSFAFAQVLQKFIEEEGPPSIVESQEYNGIAYFTLLYQKLLYPSFKNLKILITIHAPSFVCLPYNHVATYRIPYFWIGEMEKFCLKAAGLVIAPSHYMATEIRRKAPEIHLEYSRVVNPFRVGITTRPSAGPTQGKEFVFYGKASPLKGIFELLHLFERLWDSDEQIKLRLLGGVDYYYHPEGKLMGSIIRARYARYIESGQLLFEGQISPEELKNKINSALAVIIPSLVDNLPYAVIECMALGKIVLGSTSGGHTELIRDGYNGFLFSHDDGNSFGDKIHTILSLDEASARKIGTAAITTIEDDCNPATVFFQKKSLLKEWGTQKGMKESFPFLRQLSRNDTYDPTSTTPFVQDLLTVVIPYYDMGEYIEDSVRSILDSGYPSIEIIIVNDGSRQKASIEKLQLAEKYPNIRVIHKPNEGLSLARNTGAMVARGEFLAFLDPDDMVDREYYRKALEILKYYDNIYFVGSWVRYFEKGSGIWPCFTPEPPFVLYHNMINTSALVYKRDHFLRYGLNDKSMIFGMEDYDSLLGMLENGCSGVALPEPLFHYRVRKNSMARQFTHAKILYLYQLLAEKHNKFYSTFAAAITNLLNSNGGGFLNDNPSLDLHITAKSKVIKKIIGAGGIEYIRKNAHLKRTIIKIQQLFKR